MTKLIGVLALGIAIAAAVAGLGVMVPDDDTAAEFGVASMLGSLIAVLVGLVGSRLAKRRRRDPRVAQAGMIVAAATFGAWIVLFGVGSVESDPPGEPMPATTATN